MAGHLPNIIDDTQWQEKNALRSSDRSEAWATIMFALCFGKELRMAGHLPNIIDDTHPQVPSRAPGCCPCPDRGLAPAEGHGPARTRSERAASPQNAQQRGEGREQQGNNGKRRMPCVAPIGAKHGLQYTICILYIF